MTPTLEIALFVLAFCGAFVSGLVGVGGAIVMIPLLYYVPPLLGAGELPLTVVAGLSMTQVLAAAAMGTWSHGRYALVHRGLALTGGAAMAVGSLVGAVLTSHVSGRVLLVTFALMTTIALPLMFVSPADPAGGDDRAHDHASTAPSWSRSSGSSASWPGSSGRAGRSSLVPVLVGVLRLPMRLGIGTSLAMVGMSALTGFLGKALTGQVPLWPAVTVVLGSLTGAPLGGRVEPARAGAGPARRARGHHRAGHAARLVRRDHSPRRPMRYGFVIDQRKCIGCHACTVACKEENQVPLGVNRTWVKYIEKGTFPDTRRYFTVMRCNHCDNAPCVTICPTVALYRRPDGIVDFDGARCIGCKSCMQACPYDALYIDPGDEDRGQVPLLRPPRGGRGSSRPASSCARSRPSCPAISTIPAARSRGSSPRSRPRCASRSRGRGRSSSTWARRPPRSPRRCRSGAAGYLFSQVGQHPEPGPAEPPAWRPPRRRSAATDRVDLLALARTVYDVAHPERPWGWKVAAYLWTKSIAAGAFLVAALGIGAGFLTADALTGLAAPAIGLALPAA